ncbi:hypothetical protein AT15_09725 [Kosmotoga arenicorallina S304]|uniref:ABC transmembrane type-2 domain-containing protein n=1 Tax=Kosmotoga arenicorallina S304 TaxID=1453497 RepID=A0A176K1D4_9BACT|nr:ABC transporter permease [Kosmotoga arenicorallina]OAA30698.1 hypothetical protein AT15_09725 [Kosmotoga arenicorallina S304]
MKRTLTLLKALLRSDLREFETFFWSLIFPLILFFLLSSIFGNLGSESGISFEIGVVREEKLTGLGVIIDEVLNSISGEEGPFTLREFSSVEEATEALKKGSIELVFKIPKGTSSKLAAATLLKTSVVKSELEMFYIPGKQSSEIAADIMNSVFDQVDLEIAKRKEPDYISLEVKMTSLLRKESEEFNYVTFLFPGILLMSVLIATLMDGPYSLTFSRDSGLNRKLYSTPISPLEYLTANVLKLVSINIISAVLLFTLALTFYPVDHGILSLRFIGAFLFSLVTMLPFGLMIVSLVKKPSAVVAISQITFQSMMFLGGLYIPISNVPSGMKAVMYVIPTTYLVELMRRILGYKFGTMSDSMLIIVPLIWAVTSISIFSLNFKKVMGYE